MRKTVDGKIRNKERTKRKLVEAVGAVVAAEGYAKLSINKVARQALVDKKLVYRYFGGFQNLIDCYLKTIDFWPRFYDILLNEELYNSEKKPLLNSLTELLTYLSNSTEQQNILIQELNDKAKRFQNLQYERAFILQEFLEKVSPTLNNKENDLQACYAILLAGIYYLSIHSETTNREFCGINIRTQEDFQRINSVVHKLIDSLP